MSMDGSVAEPEARKFEDIAESLYPALVRRLTLVLHDHASAEDVAQSALLRGYQAWSPGTINDPRAWIFTIAMRLALNETRRRRRWLLRTGPTDGAVETGGDPDLWVALVALDRNERVSLVLSVLDGYSQAEIASRLGVPAGTVASWLSRGKAKLRASLSKEV
jgi:RNA polymerase sigma-70 factor (ECF subfamily)